MIPAQLSHAQGSVNPQGKVNLYNEVLKQYLKRADGLNGSAASLACRQLLAEKFPKLLAKVQKVIPGKNLGMPAVAAYLFPAPKCPQCGTKLETFNIRSPFCCLKCRNLFLHGVEHHTQLSKTQKKRRKTTIAKYGVDNVSKVAEVQARKVETCRANFGVDYPQQSKKVRKKTVAQNLAKYGIAHAANLPIVAKARRETCFDLYGGPSPTSCPKVRDKQKAAVRRRYGVDNPSQADEVKAKKVRTTLRNFGVTNPSYSPEIQKKIAISSYSVKTAVFGGKEFQFQGYEGFIIEKMVKKFGAENILDQFDPKFPSIFKKVGTHLDIYNKVTGTYVEVKSTFTFLQGRSGTALRDNRIKAENCKDHKVRWVVCTPSKNKLVLLPKGWYTMTTRQLKALLVDL